jgi:hypothetical protein
MIIHKRPNIIHIYLIALFVLLLFSGCVTNETYIRNVETYSQKIPIENKPTFLIFGENLTLNDYSLRFRRNTPGSGSYTIPSVYSRNKSGRRYDFCKNGKKLYTVDIITSDKELNIGTLFETVDVSVKYDINMAIVINNNYSKEEFKVNYDEKKPYVLFYDNNMGEIKFDYYKARNKNTPKFDIKFLTGFSISDDNEEYGILAFYPASLYLKNNVEINEKMALYILAAYAHYYNYGREKI